MTFILSETTNGIATITLNRPDKLNAFTGTMRAELVDALSAAGSDDTVRVVVVTGAGRGFCAGGDVEYMSGLQRDGNVTDFRQLLDAGRDVVTTIRSLGKFVIAAVNGVAAGAGCNLALACDYRLASDRAKLGETFVRIGLHPDWGGTWLLPRLVGEGRAMELLMTGRMVEAEEAERIGMVDRVVTAETLPAETMKLARAIADGPLGPLRDIKRAVYLASGNTLEAQIDLETENQLRAFVSSDAAEGMRAFFEKRAPKFS
jgi:2-(1,2-epoxy-1,2-dihydrophenyl)acetyl-CoA isomerase